MIKQYIIANGDPIKGFRYYGPFNSSEEACQWGSDNFDESGFTLIELKAPEETV